MAAGIDPGVSLLVSSLVAIGAALSATRLGAVWARKDAAAERATERDERQRERALEVRQRALLGLLDEVHGPSAELRFKLGLRLNELASVRRPLGAAEGALVPPTQPAVLAAMNAASVTVAELANYHKVNLLSRARLCGDDQAITLVHAFVDEAFDDGQAAFTAAMKGDQTFGMVGDHAAQALGTWILENLSVRERPLP